jgi:DNA modification methylase
MSTDIEHSLSQENGDTAFELMHQELDKVWSELNRVTKSGAFICINIGDATRTIGNRFQLYSNHARIINSFKKIGFDTLPIILWKKTTNAPNKFMGSGMLPSGAYITLEHEYILIFRKNGKRIFDTLAEKKNRMESAFFWEERNIWFSDVWDFKGTRQLLNDRELRNRSAAYPFELAYRLINMYSLRGDTILDPFAGTGTTLHASIASGRNSIGVEIDEGFNKLIFGDLETLQNISNQQVIDRISLHEKFIEDYQERKGKVKYINTQHNIPVVTRQEVEMVLAEIIEMNRDNNNIVTTKYKPYDNNTCSISKQNTRKSYTNTNLQLNLF